MCGIAGKLYFDQNITVTPEQIKKMTDAIAHRGPDDEGVFIDRNVGLGNRRLAIIDLSAQGHQPMSDNQQTVWITYNGEVYNFLELRAELEKDGIVFQSKTDTEVIIYLYKKYGFDCLKYLRGMFAFAIWDTEKKYLFLARDRIGEKPLKYYLDSHCFIFASELKAIVKNPEVKREIDYAAIDEYLTYQYVPHPKTGFQNIWKLEPAHYLIVKIDGTITKKQYWTLNFTQKKRYSVSEWQELIIAKLREAVKLRMISDVPLGAHLSGGIDSSLIVALMSQLSTKPVKTFSIGFKEESYNELQYARLVAKKYRTEHHEFVVEPNAIELLPKLAYQYEEPFADSSALPTWYLNEVTRPHVMVALNGDGGDENFAGYVRYNAIKFWKYWKLIPFKNQLKLLNSFLFRITKHKTFYRGYRLFDSLSNNPFDSYLKIISYFDQNDKKIIYTNELQEKVRESRWRSFLETYWNRSVAVDLLDHALYTDINTYLPDDLLVKVDIASMSHSLEVRSPFIDHEFMELTASMPSELKLAGVNKKYLLKQIASKLLPPECINRSKQGFGVPLPEWFREPSAAYLKEYLLDATFLAFGFKKEGIERLINEHQSGHYNHANHLWALLFLKHWLDVWFHA